jgi:RND family efflux transporter MFP subunit
LRTFAACSWLLICLGAAGCGQASPAPEAPPPPEVEVSRPLVREVTDSEEFTGRTEAIDSVVVQARVSGYLDTINFKDGDVVKQGEVLYRIDPRPYKAQLDQDKAALVNARAVVVQKEALFRRTSTLVRKGASSREEYTNQQGDWQVAKAAVGQAEAKVRSSQLNLDWTQVTSPISGRLSRTLVTRGNLVVADNTQLTTVVSLDPMYAYFNVDERTLLRLRTQAQPAYVSSGSQQKSRVEMGLSYEEGYSLTGTIGFEDNRVDPGTGTILLRGVFKNPVLPSGARLLSPGLFARIRLPIGQPRKAVLVSDRALGTDQGKKFLYVVNEKTDPETGHIQHVVERRYVHPGALHGGLREIKEEVDGEPLPAKEKVTPKDKVVVSGLQRIWQGVEVQPRDVKMPARGPATVAPSVRRAVPKRAPVAARPAGAKKVASR